MNRLTQKLLKSPPLSLIFKTPWIGIYPTWAAAMAAIPPENRIGYNQEETKAVFSRVPTTRVRSADYPILLHLRNLTKPGMRVVDLGGNIGMAYYTALKYFPLPESFEWVICDVPALIETAQEVALREGEKSKALRYIHRLEDAGKCDILFSSGTLQFLEYPLPTLLQKLPQLPQTLLINRIPVWDRKALATIHDIGFCICPYSIFNRKEWIESVEQLGYQLVDDWPCPESTFSIRFRPDLRLNSYHGFYFSRIS
jgi:putative methyltransferase (TIGR04325 family)